MILMWLDSNTPVKFLLRLFPFFSINFHISAFDIPKDIIIIYLFTIFIYFSLTYNKCMRVTCLAHC